MSHKLRESLRQYFYEFPEELADSLYIMLHELKGMRKLFEHLRIPYEEDSKMQYIMLLQYFRRHGCEKFIRDVKDRLSSKETHENPSNYIDSSISDTHTPPIIVKKGAGHREEDSDTATGPERESLKVRRKVEFHSAEEDEDTQESPKEIKMVLKNGDQSPTSVPRKLEKPETSGRPSAYDKTDEEGFPIGELFKAPAPKKDEIPEGSRPWHEEKSWDPSGSFPEVERRSGKERRRFPDRRKAVDIVFKNRRFGKGRRNGEERRKDWPEGGYDQEKK